MDQHIIKGATGVSLTLVLTIIGIAGTLLGALVLYIFNKCKIGWTESDGKIKSALETSITKLDDKMSNRIQTIYDRIDKERELNGENIDKEIEKLDTENEKREDRITNTILAGFKEIHKKIDSMTTQIHKIDKKVAVIESNSGKRRQTDENNS